jgi:hypothetical protein
MGYHIHITRREHWADPEDTAIAISEWLDYVRGDKEMELARVDDGVGAETTDQVMHACCEWTAHPAKGERCIRPWFSYEAGNIEVKNPDIATIQKMIHVAAALGAGVQGNDGEIYTQEYVNQKEVSGYANKPSTHKAMKPWWKFW